jgi:hypothetical protein
MEAIVEAEVEEGQRVDTSSTDEQNSSVQSIPEERNLFLSDEEYIQHYQ